MDIDCEADEQRGRRHRDYRVRSDTTPPRSRSLSPGRRPQPARVPSPRFLRHLEELGYGQRMDVDTPVPEPKPTVTYSPEMEIEMRPDMAPGWMITTSPIGRHHQNRLQDIAGRRRRSPRHRLAQHCWSRPTLRWSPGRAGGLLATSAGDETFLQHQQSVSGGELSTAKEEDEKADEPTTALDLAATIPIGGFDFDLIPEDTLPRGTKRERAMLDGGDEEYLERPQKRQACSYWKLSGGAGDNTSCVASAANQGCGTWKTPSTNGDDTNHTDSVVEEHPRQEGPSGSGHWKSPSIDGSDTHHTAPTVENPEAQAGSQAGSDWKMSGGADSDTHRAAPVAEQHQETDEGGQTSGPWKLSCGADDDTSRTTPAPETGAATTAQGPAVDSMSNDSTVVGEDDDNDEDDGVEWAHVDCNAPGPRGEKRKRRTADDGSEGLAERKEEEEEEEERVEETADDTSSLIQTSSHAASTLESDDSDVAHDYDHGHEQDTALPTRNAYYYDLEYAANMLEHLLYSSLPAFLADIKHPKGQSGTAAAKREAYRAAQRWLDGTGLSDLCHEQLEASWTEFYKVAASHSSDDSASDSDDEGDEVELGPYEVAQVFDAVWERQIRPAVGPREDFESLDQALTEAQQLELRARLRNARFEYMVKHMGIEEDAYDM